MYFLPFEFDRSQEHLTAMMFMHDCIDLLVSLLVEVERVVKQGSLSLLSE